jgi:hypothetical protein
VALVFGDRWLPTVDLAWAAAPGILIVASVGAVIWALQLAEGDARTPFLAVVGQGIVTVSLAAVLAGPYGTTGAGIAVGAGSATFALVLAAVAAPAARYSVVAALRAVAVAAVAAVAGIAVAGSDTTAVALVTAVAVSAAVWLCVSLLATRGELQLLSRLLMRYLHPRSA